MKKNKIGLTQYIKQYSDVLFLRQMDIVVYVDILTRENLSSM